MTTLETRPSAPGGVLPGAVATDGAAAPARGPAAQGVADHGATPDGVVTIASDTWSLDVLPGTGAALAAGRVRTADDGWADLLRPTPRASRGNPERCASFPMVPWSNRIRDGVLRFGDREWQLQRNAADGTAMHGSSRSSAWTVVDRQPGEVTLELDTRGLVGVNFPWQYVARVTYRVEGGRLAVTTSVRNVDTSPFPAGFGHHPYFARTLTPVEGPSSGPSAGPLLHVPLAAGYALRRGMASGPAGEVAPRADFREPHALGTAFVDDVLTGWDHAHAVTWDYAGAHVELRADELYSHLVLYAPRGRSYFAVEPATNVNDGFALFEAGVPGTGVFVLAPGEEREATFTVDVTV